NIPPQMLSGVEYAREKGLPVVIVSRCHSGRVFDSYGYFGSGRDLKNLGCIFGGDLPGQKARIKLILALGKTDNLDEIKYFFEKGLYFISSYFYFIFIAIFQHFTIYITFIFLTFVSKMSAKHFIHNFYISFPQLITNIIHIKKVALILLATFYLLIFIFPAFYPTSYFYYFFFSYFFSIM
ncbi:asparaginase family protein, partial [Clostridioides difficile DA00305]